MASQKKNIVAVSHVGGQLPSEYHTIRAIFHNFASLPAERNESVVHSDPMECHGFEWRITLYPAGDNLSEEDEEHVSIYLACVSVVEGRAAQVKTSFRGSIPSGGRQIRTSSSENVYQEGAGSKGWPNFIERSNVLDPEKKYLVDGNLPVEFDIKVFQSQPPIWKPAKTIGADMLKLLDGADGSNAAVIFEVGKGDDDAGSGGGPRELFYAHRPILRARSPTLATMADGFGRGTRIPIDDVEPDVFRMLLRYVYGEEIPSKEILNGKAKDILHVADRLGCVGLKLAAEAELVSSGINTENAAELILLADAGHHALLKEAAINYFVTNSDAVMATEGYGQVTESPAVMKELIAAMSEGAKKKWPVGDLSAAGGNYTDMCVAALRVKLSKKSLDVDGSKEMLIGRLVAADTEGAAAMEANTDETEEAEGDNSVDDEDEGSDAGEEMPVAA